MNKKRAFSRLFRRIDDIGLLQSKLHFCFDGIGRISDLGFKISRFCHPVMFPGIKIAQRCFVNGKAYFFGFSGIQVNFLKAFQFFGRSRNRRFKIADIQLGYFSTCLCTGIFNGYREGNGIILTDFRFISLGFSEFKGRIAQSMPKAEQRFDFFGIMPSYPTKIPSLYVMLIGCC